MFEAKLTEGLILKKIVESIKDIVTDVNIDISPSGMLPNFCFRRVKHFNLILIFCSTMLILI